MKLYVYVYRDKMLSCYKTPMIVDLDKEHFPVVVTREMMRTTGTQRAMAKDLALYYLGTYNDETAKFDLLPIEEKLLDLEDYLIEKDGEK